MTFSPRHHLLPSIIVVGVFYFNIAALFPSVGIRIELPRPRFADRLFRMFGLFSYYKTSNHGFEALGRLTGSENDDEGERWTPIDVYQFFPRTLGEANRRIYLYGIRDDPQRKQRVYHQMLERMTRRHNRHHPDQSVDQMRLYMTNWPLSTRGYWAEFESRKRELIAEN